MSIRRSSSDDGDCDCNNFSSARTKRDTKSRRYVSEIEDGGSGSFEPDKDRVSLVKDDGRVSLDSDTSMLPNFEHIMNEIRHKKCAVVKLVKLQIARFHVEDEARMYGGMYGGMVKDESKEGKVMKALKYLAIGATALLLFCFLCTLWGSCCVGSTRGKRCLFWPRSTHHDISWTGRTI